MGAVQSSKAHAAACHSTARDHRERDSSRPSNHPRDAHMPQHLGRPSTTQGDATPPASTSMNTYSSSECRTQESNSSTAGSCYSGTTRQDSPQFSAGGQDEVDAREAKFNRTHVRRYSVRAKISKVLQEKLKPAQVSPSPPLQLKADPAQLRRTDPVLPGPKSRPTSDPIWIKGHGPPIKEFGFVCNMCNAPPPPRKSTTTRPRPEHLNRARLYYRQKQYM